MKRTLLLLLVTLAATSSLCSAQSKKENHKLVGTIHELLMSQNLEKGEALVDEMLAKYPNNSDMWHLKSCCHNSRNECDKALECYDMAIDKVTRKSYYPKETLYFFRGIAQVNGGQLELAIEDFDEALNLAKKDDKWLRTNVLLDRARCYCALDDYDKAEADLHAVVDMDYDDNSFKEAIALQSEVCMSKCEYEEAIICAEFLLEKDCHVGDALSTLIHANLFLNNAEEAIDYAIMMVQYGLGDFSSTELKWILFRNPPYAQQAIRRCIEEDTEYKYAMNHIALCELSMDYEPIFDLLDHLGEDFSEEEIVFEKINFSAQAGRYDDAVNYINKLMGYADEFANDYYLIAMRCEYYRLAGEYDKAIVDADRLIEIYADYAYGYYIGGWCYELMGNDAMAMEYYNRGISVDDSYAYLYLMRGEQYLKAGNTECAMSDFERVLELDTEVVDGTARHYALHFFGRNDEAEAWLWQLINADYYNSGHYYDAACLYARMGDVDKALEMLDLALYLGYKSRAHIENDDDLDNIRNHPNFETTVDNYLPR